MNKKSLVFVSIFVLVITGVGVMLFIGQPDNSQTEVERKEAEEGRPPPLSEVSDVVERNGKREGHLRQIQFALELFYARNGEYPVGTQWPKVALARDDLFPYFPSDPGNGPCDTYRWISNVGRPDTYCAYACLEEVRYEVEGEIKERGGYIVAEAETPIRESSAPPETLRCTVSR